MPLVAFLSCFISVTRQLGPTDLYGDLTLLLRHPNLYTSVLTEAVNPVDLLPQSLSRFQSSVKYAGRACSSRPAAYPLPAADTSPPLPLYIPAHPYVGPCLYRQIVICSTFVVRMDIHNLHEGTARFIARSSKAK